MIRKYKKRGKRGVEHDYKGVHLRSSLELYAYKAFEESGLPFKYEPIKFVLSDSFTSVDTYYSKKKKGHKRGDITELNLYQKEKIQPITYTPDFIICDSYLIECKGLWTNEALLKMKLFKKKVVEEKLGYTIYILKNQGEINQAIEIIKGCLNVVNDICNNWD